MTAYDEHLPWVVRTDFSNDSTWQQVRNLLSQPQKDPLSDTAFKASLRFVDDRAHDGLTCQTLVRALPEGYVGFLIFLADADCMRDKEHAVLVVGFAPHSVEPADYDRAPSDTPVEQIKTFRAIPSTIPSIENNLSIANMDFEDFANSVDSDGVFRGFPT